MEGRSVERSREGKRKMDEWMVRLMDGWMDGLRDE